MKPKRRTPTTRRTSRASKARNRARVTHCDGLPEGERFFTKPEVARLLKVCVRCVSKMMRRGELPYLKIGRRLVRFRLADIERRLTETVLVCNGPDRFEPAAQFLSEDRFSTDHNTALPLDLAWKERAR